MDRKNTKVKTRLKTKLTVIGPIVIVIFLTLFYTWRYNRFIEREEILREDPFWLKAAVTLGLAQMRKEWIEY